VRQSRQRKRLLGVCQRTKFADRLHGLVRPSSSPPAAINLDAAIRSAVFEQPCLDRFAIQRRVAKIHDKRTVPEFSLPFH
jgi:hypothetical protein